MLSRTFGSTVMRVAYGISPKDEHDEALALAYEGTEIFLQAFVPGRFLVESFPVLRFVPTWFPGAGFRKTAAVWRRTYETIRHKAFDGTVAMMVSKFIYGHLVLSDIHFSAQWQIRALYGVRYAKSGGGERDSVTRG